jgi:hypoxia up-regulated 1
MSGTLNALALIPFHRRFEKPIQTRYKEAETLIPALADLEQAFIATNAFLESARQNYTLELATDMPHKYTLEELEDTESRLKVSMAWLKENSEKQKKLALYEDPVLLTAEVKARGVTLQSHVMRLLRRKAPKPKRPTTSETSTSTTQVTTEAATETSAETSTTTTEGVEPTKPGREGEESGPKHVEL